MAIDFPNSPSEGQSYDYGDVRYTYTAVGGAPGYWKVSQPGAGGPATTAEVNAGVETTKFVTPENLNTSEYSRKVVVAGPGGTFDFAKNAPINIQNSGETGVTLSNNASGIVLTKTLAGVDTKGVAQYKNDLGSTSTAHALTANMGRELQSQIANKTYTQGTETQNGSLKVWDNLAEALGVGGIEFQWGVKAFAGGAWSQRVTFPHAFRAKPYTIIAVPQEDFIGNYEIVKIGTSDASGFQANVIGVLAGNTYMNVNWIAIGPSA